VTAALPAAAVGKPVEVWFMDEARVGQQGTLTRIWAKRGTRPRAARDHRRTSTYLFGAVCPDRGTGAAVVLPHVNIEAMVERRRSPENIHLAEIGKHVAEGAHAVLVLDRAGWHTSPKLTLPENISLLPLPSYAPELNPVENVWAYLRANFLSHRVWDSYDAIVSACCDAWNKLMNTPERLASITHRTWARAVTG
jgi:transposase